MNFRFFALLIIVFNLLTACDDGDIIFSDENGFEFEADNLKLCNTGIPNSSNIGEAVFYNINNATNEAIAFEIPNRFYNDTIESTDGNETFFASTIPIIYRKFDTAIDGDDYFCSGIPDTDINITTELISDRGSIEIETNIVVDPNGDDDRDGLSNEAEGFSLNSDITIIDTDNDSFPDYLDSDDDNDNVPTRLELDMMGEEFLTRDTDGDSIPDHLDNNDDNDDILTRNEVSERSNNPANSSNVNADNVFFYLDPNTENNGFNIITLNQNSFTRTFRTTVIARNIRLTRPDGSNAIIREILPLGSFTTLAPQTNSVSIPTPETEEVVTP